jgi:hypothetical protein
MCKVRIFRCSVALAAVAILAALLSAGAATATRVVVGNLVLDYGFGFAPHALPETHDAPITVTGHEAVRTRDGTVPPPATHLTFEFNRHGHLETRGLPTCTLARLKATNTERARELCSGALVGHGSAAAIVAFPDQAPFKASTQTLFFNGPREGGDPTLLVHAYLGVPVPTTYVDSFRIERIHKGSLGYRVDGDLARIAGGYGSLTSIRFKLGRRWSFGGERLSYIGARCPSSSTPQLLGRGLTEYADGTTLRGSFFGSCQIRPG